MIDYCCPKCGAKMSSPGSLAGRIETCPKCGSQATVPVAEVTSNRDIHALAETGDSRVMQEVLAKGADPHSKDRSGNTPLILAACKGHAEIVQLLLDHKASPNVRGIHSAAPLHFAAHKGHVAIARLLLQARAEASALLDDGRTPLHFAASKGDVEMVKLLLENGANVESNRYVPGRFMDWNVPGLTALDLAERNGHTDVARIIRDGTSADAKGRKPGPVCQGLTPENLHSVRESLAQQMSSLQVVKEDLPRQFWNRGPIDSLTGVEATAEAVIDKLKEEAALIRQHVPNIQSLDVTIAVSDSLDGVVHEGSEEHILIQMARRFRNGGVDLIFHNVFRTGEEAFKFAYMRL